jgi:serine/threonine protein kinase
LKDYLTSDKRNDDVKKFGKEERIRILTEVSSAMIYLHQRNVIHRDLKSANVLLDKNLTSKLSDFGLSRAIEDMDNSKTKQIGTMQYMAPELVIADKNYNEKVDVFAFAVMMFEIISNNFEPYGPSQKSHGIEHKVAQNASCRPDLDSYDFKNYEKDLMSKCWDAEPDIRYSFKDIHDLLTLGEDGYKEISRRKEEKKLEKEKEELEKLEKKKKKELEELERKKEIINIKDEGDTKKKKSKKKKRKKKRRKKTSEPYIEMDEKK